MFTVVKSRPTLAATTALLLFSVIAPSAIAGPSDDPELIRHGDVVVTRDDLRRYVEGRIPKEKHAAFWADKKKIEEYLFGMFVTRELAVEAKGRKRTHDEQILLDEMNARLLSQFQIDYIYATATKPDFEKLALETYKASPEKYSTPERVRVEHILISTKNRSDDEAKQRAAKVYAELKAAPTKFVDLVKEYSDDPSAEKNLGDLGFFKRGRMVKPFEDAAFGLKAKGDVAEPVKSDFGYHIIRLIDRELPTVRPFDDFKAKLVADEQDKFRKQLIDAKVEHYKKLEGVKFNDEAYQALYVNPVTEAIKQNASPDAPPAPAPAKK